MSGVKSDKFQVAVYCSQLIVVLVVISASIYNLSVGDSRKDLWISLLSSSVGYILPNPSLPKNARLLSNH